MKTTRLVLLALLSSSMLSGCAAVLIAGAAGAGSASVVGERRTMGTMIDDSAIESVAHDEIKSIDEIGYSRSNIGTTSVDGILLVHGQSHSSAIRDNLVKTCMKIKGVQKVYNAVTDEDNVGISQSSHDSWVTTKIKTKMVGESGINTNSFKVVTENNVVYLMGVVTKEEGEHAAQVAASTDGVTKVVKLFKYIGAGSAAKSGSDLQSEIQELPTSAPKAAPSQETLSSDMIEVTDL
ncbi:MAG: BON domain-containing protein [Succinivibrionaceae bacterium]|nr:BON domain-containing protein [Succinivibrionaceae bacterium]